MVSFEERAGVACLVAVILVFGSISFQQLNIRGQFAQAVSAPTSELVSYYTFDNGVATDSSGGNNGNVSGATAAEGKVGGAFDFDGSNDTVDVSTFSALDGATEASLSLWVYPRVSGTNILSKWGTGRFLTLGLLGTSYRVNWRYGGSGGGGTTLDVIGGTATLNTWQYVVITYKNGVGVIYVNGQQAVSTGTTGGALNTGVPDALRFGINSGASGYFNGKLDDVRIYKRALTQQEVTDLYTLAGGTLGSTPPQPPPSNPQPQPDPVPPPPAPPVSSVGTFYVSPSGSDANAGSQSSPFKTVQKCADIAQAGSTCLVSAGSYAEEPQTKFSGTSESNRIIFKAQGIATIKGFNIKHAYITLEGFDITGSTAQYNGLVNVQPGANNCVIINNTLRDSSTNVGGIHFKKSGGVAPNNCVIKGNTLRNLYYVFLSVMGSNHYFEGNTLEKLNSRDFIYLFGNGHTFKRNIFKAGNAIAGTGNHPDFVQTFGDNLDASYDMLFEENWIENLDEGVAFGQLNSGGIDDGLQNNIYNWIFRRNVVINVGNNMSAAVPGMTWENNTFYRLAFSQGGIFIGGSLTRGDSSRNIFQNNVFLGGGKTASIVRDTSGFYGMSNAALSYEVIGLYVTNEGTQGGSGGPIARAISNSLVANGYLVNTNGALTSKSLALTDSSQLTIDAVYDSYKTKIVDVIKRTAELHRNALNTTAADYNYVAGDAPNFYPKRNDSCTYGIWTLFRFCEVHGVNGGNPNFTNLNDPDGPDNTPFTNDDGLKPLSGSPLCGKGYNGTDIGAYSCAPGVIFASSSGGLIQPSGAGPTTPPVTQTPKEGDFNGDGRVNSIDFSYMNGKWNTSDSQADLNKDGKVNTLDFSILSRNWTN